MTPPNPTKPNGVREFFAPRSPMLLLNETFTAAQAKEYCDQYICDEVIHVIEHSAYVALEQKCLQYREALENISHKMGTINMALEEKLKVTEAATDKLIKAFDAYFEKNGTADWYPAWTTVTEEIEKVREQIAKVKAGL